MSPDDAAITGAAVFYLVEEITCRPLHSSAAVAMAATLAVEVTMVTATATAVAAAREGVEKRNYVVNRHVS